MIRKLRSKLRKGRILSDLEKAVVGQTISLERNGWQWNFVIDENSVLAVWSLWRLVGCNHISVTSEDDGHQFGLPARVDAAEKTNGLLADTAVRSITLVDQTGDLVLEFENGMTLEIITTSMGYESWEMYRSGETVAVGANGGIV